MAHERQLEGIFKEFETETIQDIINIFKEYGTDFKLTHTEIGVSSKNIFLNKKVINYSFVDGEFPVTFSVIKTHNEFELYRDLRSIVYFHFGTSDLIREHRNYDDSCKIAKYVLESETTIIEVYLGLVDSQYMGILCS